MPSYPERMLTRLAGDTSFSYLLVSYVALETGTGLVNPAITNNAVSGMPQSQAGVAAAIASRSQQVGSALGAATPSVVPGGQRH